MQFQSARSELGERIPGRTRGQNPAGEKLHAKRHSHPWLVSVPSRDGRAVGWGRFVCGGDCVGYRCMESLQWVTSLKNDGYTPFFTSRPRCPWAPRGSGCRSFGRCGRCGCAQSRCLWRAAWRCLRRCARARVARAPRAAVGKAVALCKLGATLGDELFGVGALHRRGGLRVFLRGNLILHGSARQELHHNSDQNGHACDVYQGVLNQEVECGLKDKRQAEDKQRSGDALPGQPLRPKRGSGGGKGQALSI